MELTICYFNTGMNRANLLAIKKRAEWRGIELSIFNLSKQPEAIPQADIILLEGDPNDIHTRELSLLQKHRSQLEASFNNHASILATGLGYQLIGNYYINQEQNKLKGLQLVNARTVETTDKTGNELVLKSELFGRIVGFEKHASKTYHTYPPLGELVKGKGNNGEDGKEGLVYRTLIGTNIQGPFLPKNPKIADQLLKWALDKKYGRPILSSLDDTLERQVNQQTI